jgi:two-component system, cell cycle sensor histidine kinase and response regulator CckA
MSKPPAGQLRVLIVEHDAADAELCVAALERAGFTVTAVVVGTPVEFRAQVSAHAYDIVLADYRLPGWTGMDALAILHELKLDVPFILVSGTLGEERAVECLKHGAADYVLKFNLARLPDAVRLAVADREARADRTRSDEWIRRLTLALDQSPAAVLITDTSGTIEYVNQSFTRMTGYEAAEVIGQNPRLLRSGTTPLPTYGAMWSTIRAGRIWHGEIENRRKHGELFWNSVSIAPVRDATGTVTHYIGTQEDITERKLAEAALAESELRFRKLTEASFDGIDIVADGLIIEANRGFAAMFGYEPGEVIGRPILDFVAEESLQSVRERTQAGFEGTYEVVGKKKDGSRVMLEVTARNHAIGDRPCRITALRDVTDKRQLEEQLRQAQKMEAIGRLAGGVAHDFNNLLTVIRGSCDFLLEGLPERSAAREDVDEIRKAADAAAALTRQLLAFSRQQVVQPKLVLVEEVLANNGKILRRLIGEDIKLNMVLSSTPSTVRIDPGQLEQIVINLAVNARDAMPVGGQVTIETRAVEIDDSYARTHSAVTPGRFVMIGVSDTGVGMDERTRARIFEPFFTTKEAGKGTGLGLSTVYGIVKQAGGMVGVYSEPGHGATFKIYLPIVDATAAGPQEGAPAAVPRGTETVLVVEDAPGVRSVVRISLERRGYTVIEAAGGQDALRILADRARHIDLLVTDVVMPEMSGRQLVDRVRTLRPDVKVIYMSGYTDEAVVRHGVLEAGVNYIQKPFSPDELGRMVRLVLGETA